MDIDGRPWSDLPADVLREISGRVCAFADFAYFHAVCKPWRNSRDPLSRKTTTTQFLPWLLAPAEKESAHLEFRCVFSKASYRAALAMPVPLRNWVCKADGTAVLYLTIENLRPSLHNPLTGEVTHLPLFLDGQWGQENPRGIVYDDGTTFLYNFYFLGSDCRFTAALLRPGDANWTIAERTLREPEYIAFCAAYHSGKIMFTLDSIVWYGITPGGDDMLVPKPRPCSRRRWWTHQYSYVMESRGELLWVLVQVDVTYEYNYQTRCGVRRNKISLLVHALEEDCSAPEKRTTSWVRKNGRSLPDRVLFLGWPNSFAVDASRLGGHGGACAYFVYYDSKAMPQVQVGVFKYDLITNKAEFIERLPRGWVNERCTWHVPQPDVAPIKELILKSREQKQQGSLETNLTPSPARIIRHYEPSFRVVVRDLPLTVNSSQLRLFFSQHGKVSNAEVLYYKKTKRSQGIGILTISTSHANQQDTLDALNALPLDGHSLKVSLAKKGRQKDLLSSTEAI